MARVAVIGLGNMGGGMAANLAEAGHDVRAFDLSAEALERARSAGCLPAGSAAAACEGVEAVITMLPAGRHVEAVYTGEVLGAAPLSAILIDSSTIDVATARGVGELASAAGYTMVDAPVSGGIAAAAAGTLTFMVGGSAAGFARAEPFLTDMGKAVIHAGASGSGQAAKVCNNLLLASSMIATCEALTLAAKLGLDPQKFYDIASVSTGSCWSLNAYAPLPGVGPVTPADNDYQGGFASALMLKDLRLALDAAASVDADTPLGARATELYDSFVEAGNGAVDFSGIIRMLDRH
ncbi:3-hydroxyisobutyrate dehydrogenase [Sphingomonas guangdongensis]|uniref:3-hydroxyisobutyrate dehydrogenase n=1 Tax=Sphingomonas guangdongensis TaxID=1141890 RepID=A0A285R0W3_9SPHN|nr:3-hydroxyisobutyrate dehydrogenase [Sphingomonas guangdongensis]SOB87428.1 3-hydroxyisobutyrate dehydrogenase [Sphingomonas guangdongensis]